MTDEIKELETAGAAMLTPEVETHTEVLVHVDPAVPGGDVTAEVTVEVLQDDNLKVVTPKKKAARKKKGSRKKASKKSAKTPAATESPRVTKKQTPPRFRSVLEEMPPGVDLEGEPTTFERADVEKRQLRTIITPVEPKKVHNIQRQKSQFSGTATMDAWLLRRAAREKAKKQNGEGG
jgi:hypothetical protein